MNYTKAKLYKADFIRMTNNTASFDMFIPSFQLKLDAMNTNSLSINGYPKVYLETLFHNSIYYLHIYKHVLEKLLHATNKTKEEIVLVDYGAGNGLLGIFAKHCGFGKVYLNDMSKDFVEASRQLNDALDIKVDGFIEGDCDKLIEYFKEIERPDAVVGTDVIEHIYSLENFFSCLYRLNKNIVTVFTTASVTANKFKSKQLMQLQRSDEYVSSNADHAVPGEEFAGLPFIETRKKIIQRSFPKLDKEVVGMLSKATRGMNEQHIIESVNTYIATARLPQPPLHPTNTCDPVTGSWTERLLTENEYAVLYNHAGFLLEVHNGFYNEWQSGLKGASLKIVNTTISLLGKKGNIISPFITLVGTPK